MTVADRKTVWMKTAGDPRQIYLPRLEWAGGSSEVISSSSTGCRTPTRSSIGKAATGDVRTLFTDHDDAWVEVEEFTWLRGGQELLWLANAMVGATRMP